MLAGGYCHGNKLSRFKRVSASGILSYLKDYIHTYIQSLDCKRLSVAPCAPNQLNYIHFNWREEFSSIESISNCAEHKINYKINITLDIRAYSFLRSFSFLDKRAPLYFGPLIISAERIFTDTYWRNNLNVTSRKYIAEALIFIIPFFFFFKCQEEKA